MLTEIINFLWSTAHTLSQKIEEQLIPNIRDSWQAPVYTISIARRIWKLLLGKRLPELSINWGMTIFSILWKLSDVNNWNLWAQTIQYVLHHPHCVAVRSGPPVTVIVDYGVRLPEAVPLASWIPLSAPGENSDELSSSNITLFLFIQCLILGKIQRT